MSKLLVASSNPGKLREIREILRDLELTMVTPGELGIHLDVEECGSTYRENAALKARAFEQASGLLTLADDSGLEVDALGGLPGLHSARFSPKPGAADADRRALLLQRLSSYPPPWPARFRCVVAIATPQQDIRFAEGVCEGEIIDMERGTNGFGYDPIFSLPGTGRTMAELPAEEKNRVSHRARAVNAARPLILQALMAMK